MASAALPCSTAFTQQTFDAVIAIVSASLFRWTRSSLPATAFLLRGWHGGYRFVVANVNGRRGNHTGRSYETVTRWKLYESIELSERHTIECYLTEAVASRTSSAYDQLQDRLGGQTFLFYVPFLMFRACCLKNARLYLKQLIIFDTFDQTKECFAISEQRYNL